MSETNTLVMMDRATTAAKEAREAAKKALDNAIVTIGKLKYDAVGWTDIDVPVSPDVGDAPTAPDLPPVILELPDRPAAAPILVGPPPIDAGTIPTNPDNPPSINFPDKPAALGAAPVAPELAAIEFPEPPATLSNELPAAPTFTERAEPIAPEIILPEFTESLPERIADAPTDGAEIMGAAYAEQSLNSQTNADAYVDAWISKHSPDHHTQMAKLEARLSTLMNGGTGLSAEIESAIYSRARERNDIEAARARDAGYVEAANRGFTLPTGALMAGLARSRQEAANANLKASSDIAIAQAELEQKNLQFAVTASSSLRAVMVNASMSYMSHVVSINSHAMDYAKSVFGNVVELYNASVRVYSARVDAYKSYVSIYEARIKAAMVKIDVYRAEISALEALTNVDQSRAAIYRIQIEAVSSMIALYRARIEAVQGRVSLEKTKLEIFQAQTQAYGTQVQAKNAEWGGYSAAISGEDAKVRIYTAQLGAFNSQLDAYRATISAKISESDAVTKTNQANTAMYSAEIQSYTAQVSAESERAKAENDNNRKLLSAFDKEISVFQAETQRKLAQYSTEAEVRIKNSTGNLSAQIEAAKLKTQYSALLAELDTKAAKIYGDIAGAAMSGINVLAASTLNE